MALGTALVLVTYVIPIATIPATAADLGAGPVARAWILSSMSVGLAGRCSRRACSATRSGVGAVYVAGLVATAVGAVLCAVAAEPVLFVVARVVQGGGGAAVLACGLAVLAHRYPLGPRAAPRDVGLGGLASDSASSAERCCPCCSTSAPAGGRACG